jgi:trehalose synthase-fused probable maltokinase
MGLAELDGAIRADPATAMPADELAEWVVEQRWFGSKAQEFAEFNVLDVVVLDDGPPLLAVLLLEARLNAGTHELYQLPVVTRAADDAPAEGVIATRDGAVLCDALLDPRETARLGELMARAATVERAESAVRFHWDGGEPPGPDADVRVMGVEQSNSSIVLDDRFALKVFRRVEAGTNPELEMLTFLAAHDFPYIAPLEGSYNYHGPLLDATLGVMQRYIPHAGDGWALVVDALADGGGDELLPRLFDLGVVTGRMHAALASDPEDRDFAPEEPSEEHVALITATIDEQIERTFIELPDLEALEPIRGRAEELRDRLALLSHHGVGGRLIRCHGDYHLGQTVFGSDGWTVLDFEGEPGRPLRERRRKRSPLRDVAGMLRSFAYAALASELLHDAPAPPREWEESARARFLEGYMQEVDRQLLPTGAQATAKLLSVFELEKTLYELRYELNNRPDWLVVPVGAIRRLLAEPVP